MDHQEIVAAIQAELKRDEAELSDMQCKANRLAERVSANRQWLKVHGFAEEGTMQRTSKAIDLIELVSEIESSGSIRDAAVKVISSQGEKTISDLHREIVARGKKIQRATLETTIRRNPKTFNLEKRDGKVIVSLNVPAT